MALRRSQAIGLIILSTTLTMSFLEPVLLMQANALPRIHKSPRKKIARFTPSGIGAPTNRSDAATRGLCESGRPVVLQKGQETRLIALIPEQELGLTTAGVPAIAFYIPPTCAEKMRFSLLDTVTNKSYETLLATPTASGIISLNLSNLKGVPALETGKKYQWELSLVIDERDPSADTNVNGFLQRSKTKADPNFWFDAVTALIEARQTKSQDAELTEEWNSLMRLVGLEAIANQPLTTNFVAKPVLQKNTDLKQ